MPIKIAPMPVPIIAILTAFIDKLNAIEAAFNNKVLTLAMYNNAFQTFIAAFCKENATPKDNVVATKARVAKLSVNTCNVIAAYTDLRDKLST